MKDYYKILGVNPDASEEEIRQAYYKLAHKYHPDKGGDPEKFKEINEAYQVLSDKEKRRQYDMYGRVFETEDVFKTEWFWPRTETFFGFEDIEDIFEEFFGFGAGKRKRAKEVKKGKDIEVKVEINLEDVLKGKEVQLDIEKKILCQRCEGKGAEPNSKIIKCQMCKGTGQVQKVQQTFLGSFTRYVICPNCKGEGEILENPCNVCKGEGRVMGKEKIKVFIPPGIDSNQIIKIEGKGDVGRRGGKAGSLYLRVLVRKHPIFERKGDDLYCQVPISFSQATLGDEVEIETLEKKKIFLKIPPSTESGKIFRISGKGVPHYLGWGRGDLYCKIKVEIPKKLTKEQKELLKKLKNLGL